MGTTTFRSTIGRAIKPLFSDRQWTQIQSIRSRNHQIRWLKAQGILDLNRRFAELNGSRVLGGPFAEMAYPSESIVSRHVIPMLLGSYESELHPIVGELIAENKPVIDIGSAEGYYAVGLARAGCEVIAFETDAREAERCRDMARLNNVSDRVDVRGWCSPEILRELVAGSEYFVLSDCEGYEATLFDEPTIQGLSKSTVLIEIHGDALNPLLERFDNTHHTEVLRCQERNPDDYPELKVLGRDADRVVREYRQPDQCWLCAVSKSVPRIGETGETLSRLNEALTSHDRSPDHKTQQQVTYNTAQ